MDKKKLSIILVLLAFILIMATSTTCTQCVAVMTGQVEYVGEKAQEAIDSVKRKSPDEEREVTWVIRDKEGNETVVDGPSQPEDVIDLEKYPEGSVSLKGKVSSPIPGVIKLNIDNETRVVEGSIKGMGWTEEDIITSDEGDDCGDHHHSRDCEVIFDGTFFGKIDEYGDIFANVTGYINGRDGECRQLVKNKPESFTLRGKYYWEFNNAGGSIEPKVYSWTAEKL